MPSVSINCSIWLKPKFCYCPSTLIRVVLHKTFPQVGFCPDLKQKPVQCTQTLTWWMNRLHSNLGKKNIPAMDMITLPWRKQVFNKNKKVASICFRLLQQNMFGNTHWIFPQTKTPCASSSSRRVIVSKSQAGAWGQGHGVNNYNLHWACRKMKVEQNRARQIYEIYALYQ